MPSLGSCSYAQLQTDLTEVKVCPSCHRVVCAAEIERQIERIQAQRKKMEPRAVPGTKVGMVALTYADFECSIVRVNDWPTGLLTDQ